MTSALLASASAQITVTNNTPGTVDNSSDTRTFIVTSGGTIQDVDFTLNFSKGVNPRSGGGPFFDEMSFTLTSPTGTVVTLIPTGGFNSASSSDFTGTITFDQAAAQVVNVNPSSPQAGTFRPTGNLNNFNGQAAPGTWTLTFADNFGLDALRFNFGTLTILLLPPDPAAGQLDATLTQTGIQATTSMLGGTVEQILGIGFGGGGGLAVVDLPALPADVMPVSFQQGPQFASVDAGETLTVRAQGGCTSGWDAWARGYGIGGNVNATGAAPGIDYASGGSQVGVHRMLCEGTRVGLFGGYAYQNVDSTADQTANVNSGQLGGFLHRRDDCGNYYLLLVNGGYDNYLTRRVTGTGLARGEFDGAQSAVYLQRGWSIPYGCFQLGPTAGRASTTRRWARSTSIRCGTCWAAGSARSVARPGA